MVNPALLLLVENIGVFSCLLRRQSEERSNEINRLRSSSYNFLTGFQHKLWTTRLLSVLLAVVLCTAGIGACSTFKKKAQKPKEPKQAVVRVEEGLAGKNIDEVRKQLGEPTSAAKTPDDHILWVYVPSWKLMPDDRGTLYVEFENEKVLKAFRK